MADPLSGSGPLATEDPGCLVCQGMRNLYPSASVKDWSQSVLSSDIIAACTSSMIHGPQDGILMSMSNVLDRSRVFYEPSASLLSVLLRELGPETVP